MSYSEEFQDIILERGSRRVVWEYLGEGWSGGYNPDDPEDVPLLRFSCDRRAEYSEIGEPPVMEWEGMEDASYCTRMPINSNIFDLVSGAAIILDAINTDGSYKKRLEELSWFCPDDFKDKDK